MKLPAENWMAWCIAPAISMLCRRWISQTVSEWVNQYRINTVTPMGLTCALFPLLKQSEDASVIFFVGESHGENRKPIGGGFETFKAALNYLCKSGCGRVERFDNLRANFWCRVLSIRRNVSNLIRANRKANVKNYEDVPPQFIWWASRERAEGGQAKSSICKSTCSEWFENDEAV